MVNVTVKKVEELLGELPKDVREEPYYRKEFLKLYGGLVEERGEEWVKETELSC
jgi:hypothetical protein